MLGEASLSIGTKAKEKKPLASGSNRAEERLGGANLGAAANAPMGGTNNTPTIVVKDKDYDKDKDSKDKGSKHRKKKKGSHTKKGKKPKSAYRPKRWFWGKKYQSFDPLIPEVPPVVEGPISFLEQHGRFPFLCFCWGGKDVSNQKKKSKKGLNSEGLFRKTGSVAKCRMLKEKYDKGKVVDLSGESVDTVAGVVIRFFGGLPNPLLTYELYECFICAIGSYYYFSLSLSLSLSLSPV